MCCSVRAAICVQLLPRNNIGVATQTRRGWDRTLDAKGEAVLETEDRLRTPSSNELVHNTRDIPADLAPLTNRKLPNPACVEQVGDVIAAVLVVALYTKAGHLRRTLNVGLSDLQSIAVVGLAL